MKIRHATTEDAVTIDLLLSDSYAPVIARMSPDEGLAFKDLLPKARVKYAESGLWLVAEIEAQVVGCVAYFSPHTTQHPLFQGNAVHIQLLGVSRSHTKQGVGRMLMSYCLSLAEEEQAEEFLLQTSELMPEARRLYESLGFNVKEVLAPVWGQPTYLYSRREA